MTENTVHQMTFESDSVESTLSLGRRLGAVLHAGDVIGLVGQLGAGKTYMVKGIATGLGVADDRQVNSPTFVLVNEYTGRMPVFHLDTYRLGEAEELTAIGFDEMIGGGAVVIVEWADRVREIMPPNTLWIEIEAIGETDRRITIQSSDISVAERVRKLK